MIVLILAYLVSLIPGIIIFLWLRNFIYKSPEHLDRKQNCSRAVIYGIVCTIVIVLVSGTSHVVLNQLGLREANPILGEFLYTFIVLAGAEELVKFGTFWQVRKKAPFSYSALDVLITMSLVALGFQFSESIIYAFGTNAPQMIVRGVTLMHMTYGFIMGLFIAKALRTGNKAYYIPAVVIPWILHGLYDFTLAEPVAALSDAVMIPPPASCLHLAGAHIRVHRVCAAPAQGPLLDAADRPCRGGRTKRCRSRSPRRFRALRRQSLIDALA